MRRIGEMLIAAGVYALAATAITAAITFTLVVPLL